MFTGYARILRNLRLGIKTLLLHKLRSLLTMLGVVFGVSSVIAMLAIGEGSKKEALAQIERLGTNNVIIRSRKSTESDQPAASGSGNERVLRYGITYADADRLSQTIPHVKRVVPVRRLPKVAQVEGRAMDMELVGTTPDWFDLVDREMIAGRTINQLDMQRTAPVIVLTENTARRLLATTHSVGEKVRIENKVFTVIGIVRSELRMKSAGGTLDADKDAFIPLTTCRSYFGELITQIGAGQESREKVDLHEVVAEVESREHVEPIAEVVRRMFERFHTVPDYEISVPLELLRQAAEQQRVWNITLGSIAGISLLVGGIGIMNIMLASVTERTREIGVRRAIGAKRSQIVIQFLTETMVLSTSGGLVGVLVGCALPLVITAMSNLPATVPLYSVVLSVGISVGVGVVFGLYPAARAANLDPIVALRHE